jgi:hypothetical protein
MFYDYIYCVTTYQVFQHIPLPVDPFLYIHKSFDLDICKVIFNGTKLYVKDWMKLITKKDTIRPNVKILFFYDAFDHDKKHRDRFDKYTNRGFKLTKHKNYNDVMHKISELSKISLCYSDVNNYMAHIIEGDFDLEKFD